MKIFLDIFQKKRQFSWLKANNNVTTMGLLSEPSIYQKFYSLVVNCVSWLQCVIKMQLVARFCNSVKVFKKLQNWKKCYNDCVDIIKKMWWPKKFNFKKPSKNALHIKQRPPKTGQGQALSPFCRLLLLQGVISWPVFKKNV